MSQETGIDASVGALARRIAVRHREAGHVRFALPAELCRVEVADVLSAGLRQEAGVYRVAIYVHDGKLSVFYDEHTCSIHAVARRLFALLGQLPEAGTADAGVTTSTSSTAQSEGSNLSDRLAGSVQTLESAARRGLQRLMQQLERIPQLKGVHARMQPVLDGAVSEKAVINFLNDLVAFYLVRMHWDLITQRWLREPLRFRNAWLTVFYLVFLLVRYRKLVVAKK